jgi:small subunit ribosomal protein S7
VTKFINNLMKEGKKSTAEGIFYGAMDIIEQRTGPAGRERVQAGALECQAGRRSEEPPRRRRDVPGARSKSARTAAPPWRCAGCASTAARGREVDGDRLANELISASKG